MSKTSPEAPYTNYAFISYSHRDMATAKWLQRRLEGYRLPTEIHNELDDSRYLRPIFRDQTDLNTGVLTSVLRRQLERSKFLILICSANSAASAWVSAEARAFVEIGRLDRIIPVILPAKDIPEPELFPEFLRDYFKKNPGTELLGVNIGEVGKEKALVRVVSRMLDVEFDKLWNRHERLRRRRMALTASGAAIALGAAYLFAWPVSLTVQVSPQYSQLPEPETLTLNVNGADYEAPFSAPLFNDLRLPGYFRFREVDIKASANCFISADTSVNTGFGTHAHISLPMVRDGSFARYEGTVYTAEMSPLAGVRIELAGDSQITDSLGHFAFELPVERQRIELPIRLSKEGYASVSRDDEVPGNDLRFIMHKIR